MKYPVLWPQLFAFGAILSLGTGCKTVVRENIISTINTGVGITLAENPQTQLYEVKAGFIRSQFYSVPTGKAIVQPLLDKEGKPIPGTGTNSIQPDVTPEIVSGIRAKSSVEHLLLGMDIAENFAVGSVAVNSAAATAMYISQAKDSATAKAAGEAAVQAQAKAKADEREAIETLRSELAGKITGYPATGAGNPPSTAINDAVKQAQVAGLLDAQDYARLKAQASDDAKKENLLKALEGEGNAHLKALKRLKEKLP